MENISGNHNNIKQMFSNVLQRKLCKKVIRYIS